jgi:hypothetical protein
MGFKKHNWITYGRQGEIIEIIIRDSTGTKIDFFRCNNKKDYAKISSILKNKYGFSSEIDTDKTPEFKKEKEWLDSNFN